jgi:hypothetical protein
MTKEDWIRFLVREVVTPVVATDSMPNFMPKA